MKPIYIFILCLTTTISLSTSCRRDHLYYATDDKATVYIDINWDSSHLEPNGVTALVYNSDSSLYKQFSPFSTPDGISLNLPEGKFDIILFNNSVLEFKTISFENLDYISSASAVVSQTPLSKADTILLNSPDTLAVAVLNDIEIDKTMVDYYYHRPDLTDTTEIYTYYAIPQRRTQVITINVHVLGLKYALAAPITTLKYITDGCYLAYDSTLSTLAMQQFILNNRTFDTGSTVNGKITQTMTIFGLSQDSEYYLYIDFILLNGEYYPFDIDITDSLQFFDGYQQEIIVDLEIELPVTIGGDSDNGGFNTGVTDWNDIEIVIPM